MKKEERIELIAQLSTALYSAALYILNKLIK